jgi:hypothetical protein
VDKTKSVRLCRAAAPTHPKKEQFNTHCGFYTWNRRERAAPGRHSERQILLLV